MPFALFVLVVLLGLPVSPASGADPGGWVAPLAGPVVVRRAFAPPSVRWGAGHRGADLAAWAGAPVRAAGGGRVTYAGTLAGRGVVTVTHGPLRTTYEPVRPLLRVGAVVAAGDVVALLADGQAGPARAGEALLHWGLLRGRTYLDPLSLLRRAPSRLLPVAPAPPAEMSWPPWSAPVPAGPRHGLPAGAQADGVPAGAPAHGVPAGPPARAAPLAPWPAPVPAPVAGAALTAAAAGVTAVSRRRRGSP